MSNTKLGLGETLLRPFTASRPSSRASQAPIQGQSQSENIAAARAAILTILETTHWPRKSEESVKSLIDVIKQFPTPNAQSPSNNDTTHEPAPTNAEQILSALQDVRTKLDAAASRHGATTKSSAFFHRSETCNQVLNTCREQMTGALAALYSTRSDMQIEGTAPPDKPQDLQTPSAVEQEASLNNAGERPDATRTSNQQPAKTGTAPNDESTVNCKSDPSADSARRKERLDWANKAFKGVEMISGSLPIIGSYVGAAAKVGVACVELAQLADRNEEGAHMLESHTTRLSEILGQFNAGSANDDQIGTTNLIQELQKELQTIQDQIKMMNSSSTFRKTFYSMDHADKLKEFQEKIRVALEQLQLLVNLRTSDLIAEISSRQLREENDRLLNSLGDANYGAQGHAIEDVICLEGTRVAILERIENWIRGGRDSKQVLWILGMAGRGKSTLASTVWNKWQSRASCAIFHFRRGQTELQKRLICALARQLGTCTASPVKHAILECIRENKDIAQARLETQFQFLVGALKILQHPTPIIIIVDALDECEDVEYAVRFVQLIRQHAGLLPPEVKILLTCRPEAPLLLALRRSEWEEESLDLESNMDESEIRLFMEYELSRIRENRDLPGSWPSREDVQALVERSQKLFQWARTAVRYIADGSPMDRLDELLALPSTNDGLDGLYKPILSKAYERLKKSRAKTQLFLDILGFLVVAPHPISINIIAYVYSDYDGLHNRTENKSANYLREEILAGLSSLLSLPNTSDSYIRLGHTSLRDLLVSEDRCSEQPYLVNVDHYHSLLTTKCVRLMLRDLKKNICNLSDLSKSNTEVQEAVSHYVPEGLRYCSRSWSIHLCASSPKPDLQPDSEEGSLVHFERFSKEKLLGWIEVMSLIGEMKESMAMAKQTKLCLERLSNVPRCTILTILWDDAYRFITEFQEPLSFGALHVYTTPIAFCPRKSKLWEYYSKDADILFLHGQPRSEWPISLWSRSLGSEVYAVAYSPDGKMIVSGSSDGLVRLLDAETGLPVEMSFEGQTSIVNCIAFSPDGNRVASGSSDGEIRLWDVRTGSGIGRVMNAPHADDRYRMLFSVSFSPDGRTILGGYYRNTIHLWDVVTQELIGTLSEGPSEISLKAAFSPDGKRIVSGNDNGTIRFWNIETSSPIGQPFEAKSGAACIVFSPNGRMIAYTTDLGTPRTAHFIDANTGIAIDGPPEATISNIISIAFSPDGTKLACGTLDTIHLWDIETRATIGQPMVGHDSWIQSVAFSPDGRTIASGSWDKTVRTWDTGSRVSTEVLSNRAKPNVACIAVSPNGQMIVTGSDRGTITLWNAGTGFPVGPPWKGHKGNITCVDFSPNSQRIASGSASRDIRLWDVQKRCLLAIEDLPDMVGAIAFSPDDGIVAAGLHDGKVYLWDADTGCLIGAPLDRHEGGRIRCLAFSLDGKRIASASFQKICLWDARVNSYIEGLRLGDHSAPISIAFSPDGLTLSTEFDNGTFSMWNLTTMQAVASSSSCIIGFPEPFVYLRLREQWLFYKDKRIFWLPSESMFGEDLPLTLRDGLIFCLGSTCCTFDVSGALRDFPLLASSHSEHLNSFKVTAVRASHRWWMPEVSDPDLETGEGIQSVKMG